MEKKQWKEPRLETLDIKMTATKGHDWGGGGGSGSGGGTGSGDCDSSGSFGLDS